MPPPHVPPPGIPTSSPSRLGYLGSCNPPVDVPRFVELYLDGRLPVERLLSHRLTLGELNEGFDRLASGDCVRQAVVFD